MLEQLIQQPVVRPAGTYLQAFIVITCILLWIYRGVAVHFNSNVGKGPCAQRADDASEAILDVVFLLYHGLRIGIRVCAESRNLAERKKEEEKNVEEDHGKEQHHGQVFT